MPYRIAATLALALLTSMNAQGAPKYRVEVLPKIDGTASFNAVALNNRGDITGYSENGLSSRSFIYNKDGFSFLPQSGSFSLPVDINNRGQVLYNATASDGHTQPFLYGSQGALNISPGSGASGMGRALSSSGHVAGSFADRLFYYDGRSSRYLDIHLEDTRGLIPTGLNRDGTIVGRALVSGEATQGFIYRNGRASFLDGLSDAYAVNNLGQILGQDGRGYLVRNGDGSNVYLGFYASGQLNQRGWVVGSALVDGTLHAFVHRDGESVDLNRLLAGPDAARWTLTGGTDINDRGQIIGTGLFDGQRASFIATPVPEPGSWALLLCGVGVIGAVVRRRVPRPGPSTC